MRPRSLDDLVGQAALLGPDSGLRRSIEADRLNSLILWGPPGCGKTSLARVIASHTRAVYVPFSAVLGGVKEARKVMDEAARLRQASGRRTILFVDEIHRFNRAQQDAFLPRVEDGTIVLIGATTQNPSFTINSALLSRARVYRLERLAVESLAELLRRALRDERNGLGAMQLEFPDELLPQMAARCHGDARAALNLLEFVAQSTEPDETGRVTITEKILRAALQKNTLYYDRAGEEHFNQISALHKSMRNSDPDATLYWLARMLAAGEEPLYLVRRIVRFASEDIGLADPKALQIALEAKAAFEFLGLPEGELALAGAAVYCAVTPKSNSIYRAWSEVKKSVEQGANDPVPLALRNAVTPLMKNEGYGSGYRNAHDHAGGVTDLECLPESLQGRRFYRPSAEGVEARIAERLERWRRARADMRSAQGARAAQDSGGQTNDRSEQREDSVDRDPQ